MLGIGSLLLEFAPILFGCIMLIVGWQILKTRRVFGFFLIGIAIIVVATMGSRLFYQAKNHRILSSLSAAEVDSIAIGEQVIDDEQAIVAIVSKINNIQPHSSGNGRTSGRTLMVFNLKIGTSYSFFLSQIPSERRLVIQFFRGNGRVIWYDGYGYAAGLDKSLTNAGVILPSNENDR